MEWSSTSWEAAVVDKVLGRNKYSTGGCCCNDSGEARRLNSVGHMLLAVLIDEMMK